MKKQKFKVEDPFAKDFAKAYGVPKSKFVKVMKEIGEEVKGIIVGAETMVEAAIGIQRLYDRLPDDRKQLVFLNLVVTIDSAADAVANEKMTTKLLTAFIEAKLGANVVVGRL